MIVPSSISSTFTRLSCTQVEPAPGSSGSAGAGAGGGGAAGGGLAGAASLLGSAAGVVAGAARGGLGEAEASGMGEDVGASADSPATTERTISLSFLRNPNRVMDAWYPIPWAAPRSGPSLLQILLLELIAASPYLILREMNFAPRPSPQPLHRPSVASFACLALLLVHTASCDRSPELAPGAPELSAVTDSDSEPAGQGTQGLAPLQLGKWESYPAVAAEDEWQQRPIDGARWAQVSAELACAGRSNRGDPDAQRQLLRNILSYHQTTLEEIASFSARLNRGDPEEAATWAVPISEAVRGCR